MKLSALALSSCAALLASAGSAHAIANYNAIAWGAAPAAFVTSLYVGVLGRAPESGAVVAAWAANVTADPRTRWSVFLGFIGSPEYKAKYGRDAARGFYHVWANNCPRSPNNRFAVGRQPPSGSWSAQMNSVSLAFGMARMGYLYVATPYRRC